GVDKNVREAAVAMGMTDAQVLFKVELPLAMGVLLTGVRVAVVITIGVAIIAAEVSAGGLGEYIFRGLRINDTRLLLAGAVPSAVMALAADFFFGFVEQYFDTGASAQSKRRSKVSKVSLAVVAVVLILVAGLAIWQRVRSHGNAETAGQVRVAAKDFTES